MIEDLASSNVFAVDTLSLQNLANGNLFEEFGSVMDEEATSISTRYPHVLVQVQKIEVSAFGSYGKGKGWKFPVFEVGIDDIAHYSP